MKKITKSWLNDLVGLFNDQAEALIEAEGFNFMALKKIASLPAIAHHNTVIVVLDEYGLVELAIAGDPCQIELSAT